MSLDYFVVWTADLPSPSSIGLGHGLLPWPSPGEPWARSARPRLDSLVAAPREDHEVPGEVEELLGGRAITRLMVVSRDSDFAELLADAGGGVAWTEDEELLSEELLSDDGQRAARRRLASALWAEAHPRPATPCAAFVAAAATGDPVAANVLSAWAPDAHARPNAGVRHMGHDRDLNEQVYDAALARPAGLAELLRILWAHGYYPAARRGPFAALARDAGLDLTGFIDAARRDASERERWFGTAEPLD